MDKMMQNLENNLRKYTNSSLVWKVEYGTYERELERYYGNNIDRAENIFFWDSIFAMKILKLLKEENSLDKVWLYTIKAIDDYFEEYGIDQHYRNHRIEAFKNPLFLKIFFFAMIISVILSWVAPGSYNPGAQLVNQICEPLLAPFRRLLPNLGGLDISPIFAFIALNLLDRFVIGNLAMMSGMPAVLSPFI